MSRHQPRALVTGGTGYIGSNLIRRLVKDGWRVAALVRKEDPCSALAAVRSEVTVFEYCGTTKGMMRVLSLSRPEVVYHLASYFRAEHEPRDIEGLIASNVLFGTQLMECMIAVGADRLVNTGTSWQHYLDMDYSPACLYAATKQAFEAIIQFYVEAHGLKAITLKLLDTYGPDDPRPKLIPLLSRAAESNEIIDMSPGEQALDLVHIEDVVTAFLRAAEYLSDLTAGTHKFFAVRTGESHRVKDIAAMYERVAGVLLPLRFGGKSYRKREVMVPWMGGRTLPGWHATTSLEEGISKLLRNAEAGPDSDPSSE